MANDDVNDMVNEMTSQDFSPTNVTGKIQVAYRYCSNVFGADIPITSGTVGSTAAPLVITDGDHALSMALLAEAMLIEGRKIVQARNDPNITIRSTDELFTTEMRNMLLSADAADEDTMSQNVMWSNTQPSEGWDITRTSRNI